MHGSAPPGREAREDSARAGPGARAPRARSGNAPVGHRERRGPFARGVLALTRHAEVVCVEPDPREPPPHLAAVAALAVRKTQDLAFVIGLAGIDAAHAGPLGEGEP